MAFNFLGTIDGIEKFEEFEEFVKVEAPKINKKIEHLRREKLRLNELLFKFKRADQSMRKEYPLSERSDIDYIKKPRPSYSAPQQSVDSLNSSDVLYLKKFTLDQIKTKRENNEFKINRIRDKMEQIEKEIKFLQEALQRYDDILNNIRARFDIEDFVGNQKVPEPDPKDVDDSIPVTPRDAGREIVNGDTFYLVLSVKAFNKTITFDTAAPTVKPFQKITVTEGLNNGQKTVSRVLSQTTIEVFENLVDENPATSKVQVD